MRKFVLALMMLTASVQLFAQNIATLEAKYKVNGDFYIIKMPIDGGVKCYEMPTDKEITYNNVITYGRRCGADIFYDASGSIETAFVQVPVTNKQKPSKYPQEIAARKAEVYAVKNPDVKVSSSSHIEVGKYYKLLTVSEAEDKSLVGGDVVCQVLERKKSSLLGTEGRLRLRPVYIITKEGKEVNLKAEDIFLRGRNRRNVIFWTSLASVVPLFIPGEGAKLKEGQIIPLNLE